MFTTAGNTLATAKTAGSEAGSACAKQDADPARINRLAMNKLSAQSALCARTRANTFLTFIAQPSNEAIFALSTAAGTVAAPCAPPRGGCHSYFDGRSSVATDLPRRAIV